MTEAPHLDWLRPVTLFILSVSGVPDYRYCCTERIML